MISSEHECTSRNSTTNTGTTARPVVMLHFDPVESNLARSNCNGALHQNVYVILAVFLLFVSLAISPIVLQVQESGLQLQSVIRRSICMLLLAPSCQLVALSSDPSDCVSRQPSSTAACIDNNVALSKSHKTLQHHQLAASLAQW